MSAFEYRSKFSVIVIEKFKNAIKLIYAQVIPGKHSYVSKLCGDCRSELSNEAERRLNLKFDACQPCLLY